MTKATTVKEMEAEANTLFARYESVCRLGGSKEERAASYARFSKAHARYVKADQLVNGVERPKAPA